MASVEESEIEDKDASGDSSLSRPVWRAFLIAMLVFLIVEALLCLQPKRVETSTAPSSPTLS